MCCDIDDNEEGVVRLEIVRSTTLPSFPFRAEVLADDALSFIIDPKKQISNIYLSIYQQYQQRRMNMSVQSTVCVCVHTMEKRQGERRKKDFESGSEKEEKRKWQRR